jgi:hypothetical protein
MQAQQNAARLNGPYSTVNLLSMVGVGWDDIQHEDDPESEDLIETIVGQRQITISLNFFRDNAFGQASKMRTLINGSDNTIYLQQNGLGYIRSSAIRDLTQPIDETFEPRAQIDMDFYISDVEQLILRSIAAVDMTLSAEFPGSQTEISIEVP